MKTPSPAAGDSAPSSLRHVLGRRKRVEGATPVSDLAVDAAHGSSASVGAMLPKTKVLGNRRRAEEVIVLERPLEVSDFLEAPRDVSMESGLRTGERLLVLGAIAFSAGVLLFLLAQTASFLRASYATLAQPLHAASVVIVAMLWMLLLGTAFYVFRRLIKLRRSPRIPLAEWIVTEPRPADLERAEADCRQFLRDVDPGRSAELRITLEAGGCGGEFTSDSSRLPSLASFNLAREELSKSRGGSAVEWISDVEKRIVQPLDQAAQLVINDSARTVFYGTAIAPRGLFDGLIVLSNCFTLTRRICTLYGMRPSGVATLVVAARAMLNTLAASGAGEASNAAEDALQPPLEELMGYFGAALFAKITVRAAEGAANRLLIKRFGRRVIASVRPIKAA